jgi:hypothetical protein
VKVRSILSGEAFLSLVRGTALQYNPDLRPYNSSEISIQQMAVETLTPLAKYVLKENLEYLEQLRADMLIEGLDIFQLSGRVEAISDLKRVLIAPPVIEEWPDEGHLIVDGLHRFWLARKYGIHLVTCVLIRKVSLPLVPLPAQWDEIQEYAPGHYPLEKRNYRFNKTSDIAPADQAQTWGVDEQNVRYFFFRDLSPLGSSGIRQLATTQKVEENP